MSVPARSRAIASAAVDVKGLHFVPMNALSHPTRAKDRSCGNRGRGVPLTAILAATHPAEARSTTQAARTAAEREGLLAALAADEEEDEEPGS